MPKQRSTTNPNFDSIRGDSSVLADVQSILALAASGKKNWLEFTTPGFTKDKAKWDYVADHLEGNVLDEDKIAAYLIKRLQGETDDAYNERILIAQFAPYFARAVTSLAGMAWANQGDTVRTFAHEEGGEGLGDPKDPDSIMSRIWENADGHGTNWITLFQTATIKGISYSQLSTLTDGVENVTNEDGTTTLVSEATTKIIEPQFIPRRIFSKETGALMGVMITEMFDEADSFMDEPNPELRYRIYEPSGFSVWRTNASTKRPEEIVPFTPYSDNGFTWKNKSGIDVPPVFTSRLPLPTNLGWLQAKRANSLFNQENTLEFLLWIACFPKLFADVINKEDGSFDTELWDEIRKQFTIGSNIIPGASNKFDAPPMEPAQIKHDVIKEFRQDFYLTFFLDIGDKAKEVTATEISGQERSGIEAVLTLIVQFMDELENAALFALEQAYFPDNPDVWGGSTVRRSTDFSKLDIGSRIEQLIRRHSPNGTLPVTPEILTEIAIVSLEESGFPVDDDGRAKILGLVTAQQEREEQFRSQAAQFNTGF